ncbi:hypothetical protein PG2022B_0344 [Bifidobacterium animalis subsp. animalis]|uniref:Uncharacterized protein n=1 Tax=Bifidobacterium animalis subsp. lactis TaxID=302911 RepID=A0A8B3RKP8_BIFAN|nr:hypothetical protein PG2011B_0195 [Bifidobacterium animalis subsp. lactis]RYN14415.1 hypothetical protein PG2022B_0344 [Bifidobacterium animalis subsp. animalis]
MRRIEQKLLPIARKWAGNIPVWEARRAGIDDSALRHWAKDNPAVQNTGYGIYTWFCEDSRIDWNYSEVARLVGQAGPGAYLWGPSALELMEVGDVMPVECSIAVPTRRRIRAGVRWITGKKARHSTPSDYRGIPLQSMSDALVDSMPLLEMDKQTSVLEDALRRFPELEPLICELRREYGLEA